MKSLLDEHFEISIRNSLFDQPTNMFKFDCNTVGLILNQNVEKGMQSHSTAYPVEIIHILI